jgi:iron complex outermembrane receptor protein
MPNASPVFVCRRNGISLAVSLALSLAAAAPAVAQQDDEAEDSTLETITVTAQRRAEDVQEVPISITTVEPEKIDVLGSGGEDIRFLSGRLPSLLIESSFGRAFPRFYIRGLGNTDFDLNASQPVSLVYDEVVQENPILKGFPIFDLDRIEMLRGPQGTLFGRNTPAGVLKFESRRPEQQRSGYAQVSYGRYDTVNFEGALGGGLTESMSARASGLVERRDDWVDNTFTGEDDALEGYEEFAGRVQFLVEPSDTFDALINVHARSLEGTARLFRANIIRPGTNDLVDGFERDEIAIDGQNVQDLDSWGASARLAWDFGRTSLYSITGYESVDAFSRGDIDGGFGAAFLPPFGPGFIPFPAESADGLPDHSQFTQELRMQSNEWGAFDWQAGLFYFHEDLTIDSFSFDTLSGGAQNGYARQDQENRAYALYASGEYDVGDAFTVRGGLRYTHDEKDFVAQRLQSPIGAGPVGPLFADPSDSDISWDLSATWAASDDLNVYGRVARGFRAPSIQGRLLFGNILSVAESETVVSVEAGVKADLWDRRARLGFAVFKYKVDDQQLTAVGGQTNFNTLVNADETDGQGFELDFDAYLTDTLLVTLGVSYNDTEIDDPDLAIQPCGAPCTVLDPAGPIAGTVLIDGNSLPNAPEWVANLTARWAFPLGDGREFYAYTDWAYRDDVNFFLYESEEFRGDALVEGGLRFAYSWDYGGKEVALFGRNITDEEELVGAIDFNNLTGFVNEPRIWGVEFKVEF